jgi:hypothetical protein
MTFATSVLFVIEGVEGFHEKHHDPLVYTVLILSAVVSAAASIRSPRFSQACIGGLVDYHIPCCLIMAEEDRIQKVRIFHTYVNFR